MRVCLRLRLAAILVGVALATQAPVLLAQRAAPVAAGAQGDSTATARRVRPMPVIVGGTAGGALLGAAAGAGLGYVLFSGGSGSNEYISDEAAGAVLLGAIGYTVGAGLGAHFAASTAPRPNALPTLGVSILSAAVAGFFAGGMAASVGADTGTGAATLLALAAPVVHVGATAIFARWRARTR